MKRTPAESHQDPTVFEKFLEPVQAVVAQQEHERSRHHNATFTSQEFFRLLMDSSVSGLPRIALLRNPDLATGLTPPELHLRSVPRSTLNEAFERGSPDRFRAGVVFLLGARTLQTIPELAALGVLYCMEGSLFPTVRSLRWAEYKSTCQALKRHRCLELNRLIAGDILVGSRKARARRLAAAAEDGGDVDRRPGGCLRSIVP